MLSSRFPYPLEKGDKLRLYFQLRQLAPNYEIVLISISDREVQINEIKKIDALVSRTYVLRISKWGAVLRMIYTLIFSRLPLQVAYFFTLKHKRAIEAIVDQEKPDLVYCQLARMALYARDLNVPKILDYMDAFGYGMKARAKAMKFLRRWIYNLESSRMENFEKEILDFFDHTTIISAQDRSRMDMEKDGMIVVKNGIDLPVIQAEGTLQNDLVFLGNMGYFPNILAIEYLFGTILPLYKKKYKADLKVRIAGARMPKKFYRYASGAITVNGWVPHKEDLYLSGKIFVAPIFAGIGQQNKILEAMAIGIPCITTGSVAMAIGARNGAEAITADNELQFVEGIYRLLHDNALRNKLIFNAKRLIEEKFKWENVTRPLIELINAYDNSGTHKDTVKFD